MKLVLTLVFLIFGKEIYAQIRKDTIVYNYIYRDTIIYHIVKKDSVVEKVRNKKVINFGDNWGIGPYAGFDYSSYKNYGGGSFGYTLGIGISYYFWKIQIPSFKKRKHIAD
jgi:hypothetical protein